MSKIKEWATSLYEGAKDFFKRSTVIFWARVQAVVGFAIAVAGSVDWSAVASLNWTTPKQTLWIGVAMVVNGLFTELLRRRSLNVGS